MKKSDRRYRGRGMAVALVVLFVLAALPARPTGAEGATGAGATLPLPNVSTLYKKKDVTPVEADDCDTTIRLTGDGAEIEGFGASVSGGVVTISSAGKYLLTGALSGQIVVAVGKEDDVQLALDGVSVQSAEGPALWVKEADKVTLSLAPGSRNALSDSANYALAPGEDEPNGAVFSKADFAVNGTGALTVTGAYLDGIVSKDSLVIAGGDIAVQSVDDAIRGKDSVLVLGGTFRLTAGGDGVKSTNANDAGRGWVVLADGVGVIEAGQDGVQAETQLSVLGGDWTVTAGGGAENAERKAKGFGRGGWGGRGFADESETDSVSAKGLKGHDVLIAGGKATVNAADDAVHANGSVAIAGGELVLSTGDDGVHADDTLTVSGGKVTVVTSFEGLEAAHIVALGGETDVTATDDGWNAAGGADASRDGGWFGRDTFAASDTDITISGGVHRVVGGADAIDSNGDVFVQGGVTLASSTNRSMEVPMDFNGECAVTGGVFAAAGAYGRMTQTASSAEGQGCALVTWQASQAEGTRVTLTDEEGAVVFSWAPEGAYRALIVTAPGLQFGQTFTLLSGGNVKGTPRVASAGYYDEGTVQGAEELTTVTFTQPLASASVGGQNGDADDADDAFGGRDGFGGWDGGRDGRRWEEWDEGGWEDWDNGGWAD